VQRDAERTVGKWRTEAERTANRVLHREPDDEAAIEVPPRPPEPTTDAERQIDARVEQRFANLAAELQVASLARAKPQAERIAALEARISELEAMLNSAAPTRSDNAENGSSEPS